jgi:hypothetical protein
MSPKMKKIEQAAVSSKPMRNHRETPRDIFTENPVLPSSYNVTQVTLIVRDPHWIYAYWEIAEDTLRETRRRLGPVFVQSSFILRMYDVTAVDFNGKNANQSFDIETGSQARNWYVNLWCDNVSYCAEIGLRRPDGRFDALARSNAVTTPRASFSGRRDVIWMERKDKDVSHPFVWEQPLLKEHQRGSLTKDIVPPETKKGRPSRRYLSEKDIRAYYARLFPLLRRLPGKRKTARLVAGQPSLKDILGIKTPTGWEVSSKDSPLVSGFPGKEHFHHFLLGISSEFMKTGGASEHLRAGGQEGASEQRPASRQRSFFFEIGTELIVYGRTEPDAQVFLGDKNIPLRADGTFSLRFALPDAVTIPLDFSAESADKVEKRRIQTSAIRTKTIYRP